MAMLIVILPIQVIKLFYYEHGSTVMTVLYIFRKHFTKMHVTDVPTSYLFNSSVSPLKLPTFVSTHRFVYN